MRDGAGAAGGSENGGTMSYCRLGVRSWEGGRRQSGSSGAAGDGCCPRSLRTDIPYGSPVPSALCIRSVFPRLSPFHAGLATSPQPT